MANYIREVRQDRLLRELDHDPYHSKRKIKEPTECPKCGLVYHRGRWTWGESPANVHKQLCPACHRIEDKVPAAFLTLQGEFVSLHRDEVMNLLKNYEKRERQLHPLKRIMEINELEGNTVVSFTDAHLARGIGEALHHAYEGELNYQYTDEDIMLRVNWAR